MKASLLLSCTLLIMLSLSTVSCSRQPQNQTHGYIEGRYTYMATSVSGALRELKVARGSRVKQGQALFILEKRPESDAYQAAVDNLRESIHARDAIAANLTYAKITYERYKTLVPKNAVSQSQLDNARSTYNATLAQLAQANATIASSTANMNQSQWSRDQKIVVAPVNAMVFDTYYRLGEYTVANQAILSLLAPEDIKAIFYVNETVLGGLRLGDKVSVQCNSCRQSYGGVISFISPTAEFTPPVIYSNETNYKLVYRIEAEFAPDDAYHLHPGQPITVTYHPHVR